MTGNTRVSLVFRSFLPFLILGLATSARLRSTQELELIVEEMHKAITYRRLADIAPAAGHRPDLVPLALAVAVALADTAQRANE